MTRREVFDELARRGAERALVYFSGGNDEGFVDSIILEGADGKTILELREWYQRSAYNPATGNWEDGPPPTADEALSRALAKPVYDSYGSFAGEFYVSDKFVWHAGDRTVIHDGREVPEGRRVWEY